jgi:hypothetical protein
VDCGIPISRDAKLLINKPKKLGKGAVEYTMTQPILNEEPLDHQAFDGSALDTQYLEQVDPYPTPSQYQLEFRV